MSKRDWEPSDLGAFEHGGMPWSRARQTNELGRLTLAAMAARSGETPARGYTADDMGTSWNREKLPVRMLPDGTDWVPADRVADVIERVRNRLHDLIEGDLDWEVTLRLVDRILDKERDR